MTLEVVHWCALCNSARAEGTLTVQYPPLEELVDLPACQLCVDKVWNPSQLELDFGE